MREMDKLQIISFIFAGLFILAIALSIGLMFYIGRTRIKKIDKIVYGYEFPGDSIFSLMIRVPNYASAFLWEWSAKRSGLKGKIEQFDRRFRWPFIASFALAFLGMACAIIGILFDKYYGLP